MHQEILQQDEGRGPPLRHLVLGRRPQGGLRTHGPLIEVACDEVSDADFAWMLE